MERIPVTGLSSLYAVGESSLVIFGSLVSTIDAQSKCSLGTVTRCCSTNGECKVKKTNAMSSVYSWCVICKIYFCYSRIWIDDFQCLDSTCPHVMRWGRSWNRSYSSSLKVCMLKSSSLSDWSVLLSSISIVALFRFMISNALGSAKTKSSLLTLLESYSTRSFTRTVSVTLV